MPFKERTASELHNVIQEQRAVDAYYLGQRTGWTQPWPELRSPDEVKQDRKKDFLGRSMSDMAHEVHDKDRGYEPRRGFEKEMIPSSKEPHGGRAHPHAEVAEDKQRALTQSHSISYPGEVTPNNQLSQHVTVLRDYTKSGE